MGNIFFLFLLTISARADSVREENLYRTFYQDFFAAPAFSRTPANASERKLALDGVEDALGKGAPWLKLLHWYSAEEVAALSPADQLRLFRLRAERRLASPTDEPLAIARAAAAPSGDLALANELRKASPFLRTEEGRSLAAKLAPLAARAAYVPPTAEEVGALFHSLPAIEEFQNGRFAGQPRLFLFCRHQRRYPCLLAMRDKDDQPVRNGKVLWTQPALGLSTKGLPYNERDGNTPMGVHLVEGVMPSASYPEYYGKFRRLILNFVPASKGEVEQKKLIPQALVEGKWWREAVVARDIGRNLLRIHGTGEKNEDPASSFYPFVATIGCVAQREGKYGGDTFTDQRRLLDRWMKAAGMEAKFENEPNILGLLYVIDIDDRARAVEPRDLKALGIE